MALLTLEDLLAAKERPVQESDTVHLTSLGGEIEIKRIPLARYMALAGEAREDDPAGVLDAQQSMIYACCPIFHNAQLQEAYACAEPHQVVLQVLGENVGDMNRLTEAISRFYGVGVEDDLKN